MDFADFLIYLVLPLSIAAYLIIRKWFTFFEDIYIPHLEPSWLFGSIKGIRKRFHMADIIIEHYKCCQSQDVVTGFYIFFMPIFMITDLELVKLITVRHFNDFTDRGLYVNEKDDPLTGNLFLAGGEKWRFLRKKLNPLFTYAKTKMMFNTISDKGENFVSAIDRAAQSGSVDMKEISNRFMIDVVSSCALGMEANTLNDENPELVSIFKQVFGFDESSMLYIFFLSVFPKFSKLLHLRQFNKKIKKFFFNVVGGSINHRERNENNRNDFLNMLLELKNKDSTEGETSTSTETRKLTLDECVAQAFMFFFGGADTTSTVISYAITELSHHPEMQEKLRREILNKVKDSNGEITYESLSQMQYLKKVVSETLRKYPPTFATVREANNDFKIHGTIHIIKKGDQVMIPNICFHYDEKYWEEPEKFNPERFSDDKMSKIPNFAYIPFGEGPRNCIGMKFAMVNVKFAVATIIKNFKVTLDTEKVKLPLKFDPKVTALAPVGGFNVMFEKI